MLKNIITDAIVSPGYEGAPALKFSEKGDAAHFRVRKKLYVPNAAGSHGVCPPSITQSPAYRAIRNIQPHIMTSQRLTARRR